MSKFYKNAINDTTFVVNFFDKLLSGLDNDLLETDNNEEEEKPLNLNKKYNNPAEAAIDYVNNHSKMPAQHCWDWVEKIYNISGFDRKNIYFNTNYIGKDAGQIVAGTNLLQQIEPGDWLFINNRNQSDQHGNHSVIFLKWSRPNVAKVASYFNNKSNIHEYTIHNGSQIKNGKTRSGYYGITAIMKPVSKNK